jgi:hypothetical protein
MGVLNLEEIEPIKSEYSVTSKGKVLIGIVGVLFGYSLLTWLFAFSEIAAALISILTGVAFSVCILLWCHTDAAERNVKIGYGFRIAVILCAPIALAYYLFKSRGFIEGIVAFAKGFVFYLVVSIASGVFLMVLSLFDDRLGLLIID